MSFWLFPIQIFSSSSSFCPAAWRLPTPLPFVLSHEERSCLFQNFYFHFLDLLLMWEWSLKSRLCVCRDFIPTTREAKQRRTTREDEQNKPEAKLDKKKNQVSVHVGWICLSSQVTSCQSMQFLMEITDSGCLHMITMFQNLLSCISRQSSHRFTDPFDSLRQLTPFCHIKWRC